MVRYTNQISENKGKIQKDKTGRTLFAPKRLELKMFSLEGETCLGDEVFTNHLLIVRNYLISAPFRNVALPPTVTPSHTFTNNIKLYDLFSHADFSASARIRKGLGGDRKGQDGR